MDRVADLLTNGTGSASLDLRWVPPLSLPLLPGLRLRVEFSSAIVAGLDTLSDIALLRPNASDSTRLSSSLAARRADATLRLCLRAERSEARPAPSKRERQRAASWASAPPLPLTLHATLGQLSGSISGRLAVAAAAAGGLTISQLAGPRGTPAACLARAVGNETSLLSAGASARLLALRVEGSGASAPL
ncbi:hypothetical protein EMIHUDRAFT_442162, partial [Emiliania huxleyi CCMP1516]|uniref:Uncharacterized protein n=2 Tax=Emiliania huxleyi TaxID=2903 RepID=A0A0D3K7C1_EMIH1